MKAAKCIILYALNQRQTYASKEFQVIVAQGGVAKIYGTLYYINCDAKRI
jgi:hypothetical protein